MRARCLLENLNRWILLEGLAEVAAKNFVTDLTRQWVAESFDHDRCWSSEPADQNRLLGRWQNVEMEHRMDDFVEYLRIDAFGEKTFSQPRRRLKCFRTLRVQQNDTAELLAPEVLLVDHHDLGESRDRINTRTGTIAYLVHRSETHVGNGTLLLLDDSRFVGKDALEVLLEKSERCRPDHVIAAHLHHTVLSDVIDLDR